MNASFLPVSIQARLHAAPAPDLRCEPGASPSRETMDEALRAFFQRQVNLAFLIILLREPLDIYLELQGGAAVAESAIGVDVEAPGKGRRAGERALTPTVCRRLRDRVARVRGPLPASRLDDRKLEQLRELAVELVHEVDALVLLAVASPPAWTAPDVLDDTSCTRALRAALAHEEGRTAALHARLVMANAGLVRFTREKYFGTVPDRCGDVDDCLQEGMIGLGTAVAKFLPSAGAQLSTYAVHWICANMRRHYDMNQRLIRIPVNKVNAWSRVRAYEGENPDASEEEIADALGLDARLVKELRLIPEADTIGRESAEVREDGLEAMPDTPDPFISPDGSRELPGVLGKLTEGLAKLPPQHRLILALKYDLDDACDAAVAMVDAWAEASLRFSANLANKSLHERLESRQ